MPSTDSDRQSASGDPAASERCSGWRTRDILRAALLVAGVWLSLQLLWMARSVFVLAFLGVLFGVTLSAGVSWMNRRGIPRGIGALLLVLAFFGVLGGLGAVAAPRIAGQVQELQQQLPDAISRAEEWIRKTVGGVSGMLEPGGRGEPGAGPAPIRHTIAEQLGNLGSEALSLFSSTLALLASILVVTFVAVYIAAEPRTYRRGLLHLVPHRARPKAIEVLDAMGVTLRRWLVAQLIGMVSIGAITTVALLLLDIRAAVALGIIAGILEFIPYFGPIISAVPAIAMGFLDGPATALWVALAFLAIQQLEGNLLMPLLMKEGLDLPPVLTILAQAAMGLVFGFVGLLIAVPLLGVIMVPIKLLYVQGVVGDEVNFQEP